jgi:hypothetical protein
MQDVTMNGAKIPGIEAPRAYDIKGGDTTEQEIKDFMKQNAASCKQLRCGVVLWTWFQIVHRRRY